MFFECVSCTREFVFDWKNNWWQFYKFDNSFKKSNSGKTWYNNFFLGLSKYLHRSINFKFLTLFQFNDEWCFFLLLFLLSLSTNKVSKKLVLKRLISQPVMTGFPNTKSILSAYFSAKCYFFGLMSGFGYSNVCRQFLPMVSSMLTIHNVLQFIVPTYKIWILVFLSILCIVFDQIL